MNGAEQLFLLVLKLIRAGSAKESQATQCWVVASARDVYLEFNIYVKIAMKLEYAMVGALAEQLVVPVTALYKLPDSIDDTMGALIEPGGNALRAAQAAQAAPGKNILIYGTGTIGLLAAQFAMAMGATVHMISLDLKTLALAKDLGVSEASQEFIPVKGGYDAVIDATNSDQVPAKAVEAVEPGGRLVLIGFAGSPSLFDSRRLVLKDVTAVGILSGSPALATVIEFYASGKIDPRPLVAATVGLAITADVLSDKRISGASNGPKILIDPTI
jgi:threonine dehydrogenase-like Zn-dependent dehydrogenase